MIKMKVEHSLTQRSNGTTKSTTAVTYSSLRAWFFSSALWANGEGVFFKEISNEKTYEHCSVLFSFLEVAFKRRSTATEPEIKLMSAQLKTHLAVYCDG